MNVKTIYLSMFLLGGALLANSTAAFSQKVEKLTAVYKGLNEDYEYEFQDANKKKVIFKEVDNDVEIDLYDEDYIDTKFIISWVEESYEVYDEDDEPTGNFEKVARIVGLKETK